MNARHKRKLEYREKLKEKFQYNKDIKRISKHRHLPKYLHNAKKTKQIVKESKFRKLKNKELNNPGGNLDIFSLTKFLFVEVKYENERKDKILEVME